MATRKNFIENGRRADPMGSNPHSYGLVFSEYVFSWGSQNAISTSREARVTRQHVMCTKSASSDNAVAKRPLRSAGAGNSLRGGGGQTLAGRALAERPEWVWTKAAR